MSPKRKRALTVTKRARDASIPDLELAGSGSNSKAATLMVEILDRIFALVSERYFEPIFAWLNSDDFVTSKRKLGLPLVNASRVNRHWYAAVQRQLYRTVVISNPATMLLLAQTIKKKPHSSLVDSFHSFTIEYWYKNLPSDPEKRKLEEKARRETNVATWDVISAIKTLHHFGLSSSSLEPIQRGGKVADFMHGLKSLSMREDNWSHHSFSRWITAAAPTLERIRAPSFAMCGVWPTRPPMVHLRSLCVHRSEGWRLAYNGPAFCLEDLSVRCTSIDASHIAGFSAMLHRIAPTIRRLHLGISFTNDAGAAGAAYDALKATLPLSAKLHTFELLVFLAPLLDDRSAVVDAIPSGVHTLTLRQGHPRNFSVITSPSGRDPLSVYGDETEAVLSRVGHGELTALKTFTMAGKLYFPEPTYDYYAKERKVFARRQTQLVQSAKKLGVKLMFAKDVEGHLPWYFPS